MDLKKKERKTQVGTIRKSVNHPAAFLMLFRTNPLTIAAVSAKRSSDLIQIRMVPIALTNLAEAKTEI